MAEFNTLIPDVLKLLDGHDLSETIQQFSDKLGATLTEKLKKHGVLREPKLYMSNVGKPLRQLWYDLKGFKGDPLKPEDKLKFLYGDIIEEIFVHLAKEAGHDVQGIQQRIELDGVSGRIDGIIDGVLVDVKSCSTFSWRKFREGTLIKDDPFGYIAQLTGYKQALGIDRAAFIAIDKTLGNICVFEIPKENQHGFDVRDRIRKVREALGRDHEPERCYKDVPISKKDVSGNMVLGVQCSYCPYKRHCWRDSNGGSGLQLRYYSTGPKWFTKLVKEPKLKNTWDGGFSDEQEHETFQFPAKG
jgi:hypothetical protein